MVKANRGAQHGGGMRRSTRTSSGGTAGACPDGCRVGARRSRDASAGVPALSVSGPRQGPCRCPESHTVRSHGAAAGISPVFPWPLSYSVAHTVLLRGTYAGAAGPVPGPDRGSGIQYPPVPSPPSTRHPAGSCHETLALTTAAVAALALGVAAPASAAVRPATPARQHLPGHRGSAPAHRPPWPTPRPSSPAATSRPSTT